MSKTDQAAIDAAKPQLPITAVVSLETTILRGDQQIDKVTLRKPASGELRGVSLIDLIKLDVNALIVVLPRISSPTLTTHDVAQMDTADMFALGAEVAGFFATKAERASRSPSE